MDVVDVVGATRREVRVAERDGQPARQVVATRTYPTDPEDLWDALTSAERIPRWFLPVTGDLRVGGRYQLEGNAGGEVHGVRPARGASRSRGSTGGEASWVDRLADTATAPTARSLELVHTGGRAGGVLGPVYGPGAVGIGWDLALLGLARHLPGAESLSAREPHRLDGVAGGPRVRGREQRRLGRGRTSPAAPTRSRRAPERSRPWRSTRRPRTPTRASAADR